MLGYWLNKENIVLTFKHGEGGEWVDIIVKSIKLIKNEINQFFFWLYLVAYVLHNTVFYEQMENRSK